MKRKHAQQAFNGEGARLYGGRWNPRGIPMIYCAGSRALAALELLVHLQAAELMATYVLFEVQFEEASIAPTPRLPKNWRAEPPLPGTAAIGKQWIEHRQTTVLRVPSAILPEEDNFLLNPRHPDFTTIKIGRARPFQFNPRLAK